MEQRPIHRTRQNTKSPIDRAQLRSAATLSPRGPSAEAHELEEWISKKCDVAGEKRVSMSLETSLGDVASITMGQSPKGSTYNCDGHGMPLLNGPTEFGVVHPECTLHH